MRNSPTRSFLRRQLEAHLRALGYSCVHTQRVGTQTPEIARVSPVRGRIAYGEVVLRSDLEHPRCHERLLLFSQRRTRRRSSILLFIGVAAADQQALEALLARLDIRNGIRGGHVHVVPIAPAGSASRTPARSVSAARR